MPVLDGRASAIRLREDDRLVDLTVVALTSHELPDEVDEALDAGCDAFIVKPTHPERLLDEVGLLMTTLGLVPPE